jgi:hypothetical protein
MSESLATVRKTVKGKLKPTPEHVQALERVQERLSACRSA